MAKDKKNKIDIPEIDFKEIEENINYAHTTRRYVNRKETFGYILNHWQQGFNVRKFQNRFIYDVLLIDFRYLAFMDSIAGVWDIINDTFTGAIIDRTRTRWGKFRPYLLGFSVPITLFSTLYWFMPFMFPGTLGTYLPKFIAYFLFNIIKETATTFTGIAGSGLLSTITPFPTERTRLIMQGNLLAIGSNVPELIMSLMIDLVNKKKVKWQLRSVFLGFGLFTDIAAAAAALFFFWVSKERVMQSIEKPSLLDAIKSIVNNKLILLVVLSSFFEGFAVGTSRTDYFIDVLGSAMLQNFVGIPGGIFSYSSYAMVGRLRKKFSTKFLWIITDIWGDACWISVCVIGMINKNYQKVGIMFPVLMIEECLEMCWYATKKQLPQELYNESMDYCEWKNGYRTEAMTGVAKGLINKLQGIVNNVVKSLIMQKIGYEQGRQVGTQDDRTKFWLFVLCTGFPIVSGSLGIIPKFFYPLSSAKRDLMYAELAARRAETAKRINESNDSIEVEASLNAESN